MGLKDIRHLLKRGNKEKGEIIDNLLIVIDFIFDFYRIINN